MSHQLDKFDFNGEIEIADFKARQTINGFLSSWIFDTPETNYTENHSAGSLYYIKTLTVTSDNITDRGGTIYNISSNSSSTKPVIVVHHGVLAAYDASQHIYTINDLLLYFPEDVTTADKISLSVEIRKY